MKKIVKEPIFWGSFNWRAGLFINIYYVTRHQPGSNPGNNPAIFNLFSTGPGRGCAYVHSNWLYSCGMSSERRKIYIIIFHIINLNSIGNTSNHNWNVPILGDFYSKMLSNRIWFSRNKIEHSIWWQVWIAHFHMGNWWHIWMTEQVLKY